MPSQIRLDNIAVAVNETVLFTGVNVTLGPGCLAVMGPSGSGKSTLLQICAGLMRPASGTVRWDGRDVAGLLSHELYAERSKIGYMFQQPALISNMTVFDNIALPLRYHGVVPEKTVKEKVGEYLETFHVEAKKDVLPEALSASQARLVSFARAMVMQPQMLFLDEPLSGLDPAAARIVAAILGGLIEQEGLTIIMASHIIKCMERRQCPVLYLDGGQAVWYERMDAFLQADANATFVTSLDEVV